MINEIMIVALTLMGEAEGEPYAGKVMIAEVIVNRARASKQPLKAICLAKSQFSCWNGKRGKKLIDRLPILEKQNNPTWTHCEQIAEMVCKPGYISTTKATHYYNPDLCCPKWATSMWIVATVGRHLFLRENR